MHDIDWMAKFPASFDTFLTKKINLSSCPPIKYFALQISITWPVYRNINDKQSSLGVGLKGIYISSVSSEWYTHELKT